MLRTPYTTTVTVSDPLSWSMPVNLIHLRTSGHHSQKDYVIGLHVLVLQQNQVLRNTILNIRPNCDSGQQGQFQAFAQQPLFGEILPVLLKSLPTTNLLFLNQEQLDFFLQTIFDSGVNFPTEHFQYALLTTLVSQTLPTPQPQVQALNQFDWSTLQQQYRAHYNTQDFAWQTYLMAIIFLQNLQKNTHIE